MLQPDKATSCEKGGLLDETSGLPLSNELLQKQALHVLGENAAAVLHELRGPLQAIRSHVQLLERKADPLKGGDMARHFPPIYDGIDHISALLDQFLHLSRLTAANLTQLDIAACLEEIVPLLHSMAVMRNIELITDFEPGLPACLGDEQQLKRLTFNLFANACDAIAAWREQQEQPERPERAKERRGQIHLLLKRDGAAITLTVRDNGCGIGPDKLQRIWLPYFTDKATGTGLGLSSCLNIAKEHSGTLTVESRAGEGSSFTLHLPLWTPEEKLPPEK